MWVIDVGNNLKLVFKIESHNHPSAIELFIAATGVGGILRDIFTMGARPIAVLNSLRFAISIGQLMLLYCELFQDFSMVIA